MRPGKFGKTRARAPLRLGLAGGGTDLPSYCSQFGGAVLNVTIDRYAFASLIARDDGKICFEADDMGMSEVFAHESCSEAELRLHRGVYQRMIAEFHRNEPLPLTVRTTVDAPPGSGLGSSSALVVALVEAFATVLRAPLGKYDIARLAFDIEREDLGLSGGKQDQYAAAFGGLNYIEFLESGHVIVNPLLISDDIYNEFETSIVICFSGRSRESAAIIDRQTSGIRSRPRTVEALHQLKSDASAMRQALVAGEIDRISSILNASWQAKQATASGISTDRIDMLFDVAMANGALAGKVSGAGGGGFMFFLVHAEHRYRLMAALNAAGGEATPVKFTSKGSESWHF